MTGKREARIQVAEATEILTGLQNGLLSLQSELLDLELMNDMSSNNLLVIDRAEDLRRSLTDNLRTGAQAIRDPLASAESAFFDAAMAGRIDAGHARTMTAVVLQAARESRHLQFDIADAAAALLPVTSASPSSDELAQVTRLAISRASTSVEHARRSAYTISEILPLVERGLAIQAVSRGIQAVLAVEVPAAPESALAATSRAQERHREVSRSSRNTGISR